jgi:hypothetical protein
MCELLPRRSTLLHYSLPSSLHHSYQLRCSTLRCHPADLPHHLRCCCRDSRGARGKLCCLLCKATRVETSAKPAWPILVLFPHCHCCCCCCHWLYHLLSNLMQRSCYSCSLIGYCPAVGCIACSAAVPGTAYAGCATSLAAAAAAAATASDAASCATLPGNIAATAGPPSCAAADGPAASSATWP